MNVQSAIPTVDLSTIKGRQQLAWGSGDYAIVGTTLQIVGETLCEAVDLRSNQRVLDVAAGNGNATLAAARRFADVVSTDYVGALLEGGRRRAEADVGVRTRPEPLGELVADVELDVGVAHCERLRVGVRGHELDAAQTGVDHAIDRIGPTAADADDLDDREVAAAFHVLEVPVRPSR